MPGQTAAISSSFVTSRPGRSAKRRSTAKACGLSGTGLPVGVAQAVLAEVGDHAVHAERGKRPVHPPTPPGGPVRAV